MIYFITVNYYSADLIQTLLQSIQTSAQENYQVIIVNNSPKDQAVYQFAHLDNIAIIAAEHNLGFGGGCNLGIQYVYEQEPNAVIWLINPDAHLIPGAISYVEQCLYQEPQIAILGTRIQDFTGDLWFARGSYNPWLGSLKHRLKHAETSPSPPKTQDSRWVSGCSLILNLSQFQECPNFDTQYFLDYEDADLCERYYRQGYCIKVTQAVLVRHAVSAITHRDLSAKFQHATFSKLYFLKQHGTGLALGLNLLYMLIKIAVLLPRSPQVAVGRWQGFLDFIHWSIQYSNRAKNHPIFIAKTSFTIAKDSSSETAKQ